MQQNTQNKPRVKIIFVLIDGIGELQIPELKNKTPLETGNLPYINAIAKTGLNGLMDPVETGLACGSDTAHMNIFGYNPFKFYRGRGSFESMGSGIPMTFDDIAFKCNFAHMNPETGIVEKRRVDREFPQWGLPLIDVLDQMTIPGYKDHKITVLHATEHRCGVKVSGPNLTDQITGTDPLKDNLALRKVVAKDPNDKNAVFTAGVINTLSDTIHKKLSEHPINKERQEKGLLTGNIVLLRGAGQRIRQIQPYNIDVEPFEKVHGLKSFMIAPTAIINGLGQSIGIEPIKVEGTTGDYHSKLYLKGEKGGEIILKHEKRKKFSLLTIDYDFGFLHVKAVDDAGHDKSLEKKVKYFEKSDELLKSLVESLHKNKEENDEVIIALTGDHTTPILIGDHTFEPVPYAITTYTALAHEMGVIKESDLNEKQKKILTLKDNVDKYNENSAAKGALGRFPGSQQMETIKNFKKTVEGIMAE